MKIFKLVLIAILFTAVCCSTDDPQTPINASGNVESPVSIRNAYGNTKVNPNVAFKYKKSIWVKSDAAIQLTPNGYGIVYNPNRWSIFEYAGGVSAYSNEVFGIESGCDCGPNETCINGVCQPNNPCGNCPPQTTCINGMCVDNNPCGGSCPEGSTCVNGICSTNDPCANCQQNETCVNGICQTTEPCNGGCPAGETCINGICTPDQCDDCEEDEICIGGKCEPLGGGGGIGQIETSGL